MKLSNLMLAGAMAGVMGLTANGALAQGDGVVGCWTHGTQTQQNVCFGGSGNGLYLLVWGKGRCGGNAYINDNKAGRVDWEVPRQVNACYQDGKPERLAARSYSCSVRGSSMNCRETIYLDDGKIWRENEGVVFTAQ